MPPTNPRNRNLTIPTRADHDAFDGAHCGTLYRSLPPGWRCPGCDRDTFQILRWTKRQPKSATPFGGWVGGYTRHHDHSVDDIRYGRAPADGRRPRFQETVVCEQCNSADGTAKRKLRLPAAFSFSPWEIRRFVTATPHGFHAIDFEIARKAYEIAVFGPAPRDDLSRAASR